MPTLSWLTRDDDVRTASKVPYRLLEADLAQSAGDPSSGNMLIQGDNLDALKSLLPYYAGRVKCVYIDPPFGTGKDFDNYDDFLKHSQWLAMMMPRLSLLRELLTSDGYIAVHLDTLEAAYAKVLLDEVFGRANHINTVISTTNDPSGFKATASSIFSTSNYIFLYAKDRRQWIYNTQYVTKGYDSGYNKVLTNPEENPLDWTWQGINDFVARSEGFEGTKDARRTLAEGFDVLVEQFAIENADRVFQLVAIGGGAAAKRRDTIIRSAREREQVFIHPGDEDAAFYIANGRQMTFYSGRLVNLDGQIIPGELLTDVWTDISWNGIAEEGGVSFKNGKKPERLVERVLALGTLADDLVLDSFLGSGTTAAVAHKMGRRWIGIEMGNHATTHCAPRLVRVIDGEQSGISQAVGWQGGGGFSFYRLSEPVFDADGRIHPGIVYAHLAAHVWFSETGISLLGEPRSPFLGVHGGRGYALLYNGVLGDRRPNGGNVLTNATLAYIREAGDGFGGALVIYGEASRLSAARLKAEAISFKQTPYDVRAR